MHFALRSLNVGVTFPFIAEVLVYKVKEISVLYARMTETASNNAFRTAVEFQCIEVFRNPYKSDASSWKI